MRFNVQRQLPRQMGHAPSATWTPSAGVPELRTEKKKRWWSGGESENVYETANRMKILPMTDDEDFKGKSKGAKEISQRFPIAA